MKDLLEKLASATRDHSDDDCDESDQSLEKCETEELAHSTHLCRTCLDNEEYVTHISANSESDPKVAIASSNGSLTVYTLSSNFCVDLELSNNSNHIVELKFDKFDNNLLWTATHDGTINQWDLRAPTKAVSCFTDTSDDEKNKKFNCFDVSSCGRLLCAGTDRYEDDSFLLFWDIRKSQLAGGFWESHMDDITQVKFHPSDQKKMFSASTDGLINVYDLSQTCEDDALVDTLNTESSIEKISCTEIKSKNLISCITHTADLQFWKEEDVQPYISLSRNEMGKILKRKSADSLYIVDVHSTSKSSFALVGCGSKNVRGLILDGPSMMPSFGLFENQQRLKCSWYNDNTKLLLTGGEKGQIDAWKV
ncbi:WD repeat-containing protein 89 [Coccinella septempunctata]|uniref:WD repeat-containing protein 89 n=1 Tax=Coccinella septempunctata TaxID=41139 RepID=UPI001D0603C2|nr:WD repeat-containing protein 89 [Coccinella septempunctata]